MGKKERKAGIAHKPRTRVLAPGVNAKSRTATARARGEWKFAKKGNKAKQQKGAEEKKEVKLETKQESRWYEADDVATPVASRKNRHAPARLRKSITPGTVLIILAGRFKGKRVVFLKQLPSGLLLVTGPFKINGVPLRRVNQAYVISTSTTVDVSGVDVKNISDAFFAKKVEKKAKKEEFFAKQEAKKELAPERKAEQKKVDAALLPVVLKTKYLKQYLGAKFSLTKGQAPHALKF